MLSTNLSITDSDSDPDLTTCKQSPKQSWKYWTIYPTIYKYRKERLLLYYMYNELNTAMNSRSPCIHYESHTDLYLHCV